MTRPNDLEMGDVFRADKGRQAAEDLEQEDHQEPRQGEGTNEERKAGVPSLFSSSPWLDAMDAMDVVGHDKNEDHDDVNNVEEHAEEEDGEEEDGEEEDGEDVDDDDESVQSANVVSSPLPLSPRPGLRRENPFFKKRNNVVRRKTSQGGDTGTAQTYEILCQPVQDELYYQPMNPAERRWRRASVVRQRRASTTVIQSLQQDEEQQHVCQYRLTSRKIAQGYWNPLKVATRDEFQTNRGLNGWISDYLVWSFQTNMVVVFLASASFYILFTLAFAVFIYVAGLYQPECIDVGSYDFNSSGQHFMDAFSLSWQTTTTAGYGLVYPAVGSSVAKQYCVGLNIVTALESFGGVLLAGCITALIFSKMVRVQAVATVEFSDPLVVRYGTGVMPAEDDVLSLPSSTEGEVAMAPTTQPTRSLRRKSTSSLKGMISSQALDRTGRYPCPVLEFRLINQLHDQAGGEICNASINVVAVTAASRASPSILSSVDMGKRRAWPLDDTQSKRFKRTRSLQQKLKRGGALLRNSAYRAGSATGAVLQKSGDALMRKSGAATVLRKSAALLPKKPSDTALTAVPEAQTTNDASLKSRTRLRSGDVVGQRRRQSSYNSNMPSLPISMIEKARQHLAVDEDPSVSLFHRRIFSKLDIETDTHPLFKRVWNIRHVLHEHSPIVSNEAKRLIEANQGFWPEELNSYEKVRKNVHFHELVANFSGTSNVSGVTVYSQKVYLFSDLNVGYRFAQVLCQSGDGRLIVDSRLLNDVTEQYKGGAEPMDVSDGESWLQRELGMLGRHPHATPPRADDAATAVKM